jgi:hypothetical protein
VHDLYRRVGQRRQEAVELMIALLCRGSGVRSRITQIAPKGDNLSMTASGSST